MKDQVAPVRCLTVAQVIDRTGKSHSSLYELMNERSPRFDPGFPKPFKLGGRRTYFLEAEVVAWILEKAAVVRN